MVKKMDTTNDTCDIRSSPKWDHFQLKVSLGKRSLRISLIQTIECAQYIFFYKQIKFPYIFYKQSLNSIYFSVLSIVVCHYTVVLMQRKEINDYNYGL